MAGDEINLSHEGLVVRSTGSWYLVSTGIGEINCKLRGKFRIKGIKSTNPVAVGDQVIITLEDEVEKTGVIQEIRERKNYIVRKAVNLSKRVHIICSNIDQAVLLYTLEQPFTPVAYIDKLIATCEAYHIEPVLILNKTDLLETAEQQKKLEDIKQVYLDLGYTVHAFSALDNSNQQAVIDLLKDKTSVVIGKSGAGKSTLVNLAAPELRLKTGNISGFREEGRHTTTYAELFRLPFGGSIIDSPGFKEMEIVNIDRSELSHYFREMAETLQECKFNDCLHINEPGCAVVRNVKEGTISTIRYNSYLNILQEIESQKEY